MVLLRLAYEFFLFALKCKGINSISSKKLKDLLKTILDDKKKYYAFSKIENIRRHYLRSKDSIEILDFGGGSLVKSCKTRKLASIMKTSSSSPWQGRILFRLSLASKAHKILELGSSLGISLAYLSIANKKAKVLSIEGDPNLAALSRKNMKALLISNSRIIEGAFDDKLEQCLNELNGVDLAFIDGNHKYEPSLKYFNQILPYCHTNTILVFDDIYWSSEMKRAWNKIITDSRVSASVNLFHFGIVFFDQQMHGHHHILPKLF